MCCTKKPAACKISGLFFILTLITSLSVQAEHPSPFNTRDQSPFSLIFGLPLASSASLLPKQQSRWISSLNISNTVNAQSKNQGANNSEKLFIDIETWNINLLYDYGLKENWMLRVQLPYVVNSGGFLDSAIDAYHQATGLPEGVRPFVPQDQIDLNYQLNNQRLIELNDKQNALGDISIALAWQASKSTDGALSYWLSLKLPTGDANKLSGSGATDIAAWASSNFRLSKTRWLYGQGGLLYMSTGDVLTDIQNNWAAFGNAGIKFQPWDSLPWSNIKLKAQFDFHSAFYRSQIEFLGDVIQLTFGGSYVINKQHSLDFAIAEDIKNEASPDVNFNISWQIYL